MALELYDDTQRLMGATEPEERIFQTVCVYQNMALEVSETDVIYKAGSSFSEMGLDENIIRGLRDYGIHTPSLIQSNIFPYIFSDEPRNILAQSQSGTGKTVSYILVALQVVDFSVEQTQVLVITPTIELSYQVHEKIKVIGKELKSLRVELAIKDKKPQYNGRAQIIVGCVGTILRWLQNPRMFNMDSCRFILLDEADSIILQKNQLNQFFAIKNIINQHCLHLFCSATFDEKAFDIAEKMMYKPMCIRLRPEQLALNNIHQYYCKSSSHEEKIMMVGKIIKIPGVVKTIVFCNRRDDSVKISRNLQAFGIYALTITGGMKPDQRTNCFDTFRRGLDHSVLICTDVCSRGIDISTINAVINFHIPRGKNSEADYSSYYHRIGRGGRFGRKSISFTLISNDEDLNFILSAEQYFKIRIPEIGILNNNFESDIKILTETSNRSYDESNGRSIQF